MSESSVKITKKASQLVWGASPAGTTFGGGFEPGTKDFFENVLSKRSQYEMPWLFELVPFSSFCNKEVLELGCGAGYDAYEFCCNGAKYTGIDITPENINRTRKHLNYYGYSPTLLEGDAENLSFEDKTFDAVYSLGVLHHTPDIQKSFNEAYRVLKPSGDFWIIVYHKNSIVYWLTLLLVDHWLRLGFLKRSFKERLSMVEYTTSDSLPLVNVYSRSSLKKLLNNAGFTVECLWVRKLVHLDLPAIPLVCRLWRFVPQPWLDFVGKSFGWYVIAKAKKEKNE